MYEKEAEPLSLLHPSLFVVDQNSRGNWVIQDLSECMEACLSIARRALRSRAENGYQPRTVVLVSGNLELDMSDARRCGPLVTQSSICSTSVAALD